MTQPKSSEVSADDKIPQQELSHEFLSHQFADLKANFEKYQRKKSSQNEEINAKIEELQAEIQRIEIYMFIMLIVFPIKIIVITIQTVRFAKYVKKKKPAKTFVRSFSRPAAKSGEKSVEIVITQEEEDSSSDSDGEARNSRTITPKSMRSIYEELQESDLTLKNQEKGEI